MGSAPIGDGEFAFDFDDDWFDGDHHHGKTDGWAHHGIAVTSSGEIYTFDESRPVVQVLDRTGKQLRSFEVDLTEGHGMALVQQDGEEFLWISDNGDKSRRTEDGSYAPAPKPVRGAAVRYRLDGTEVQRITAPALPVYEQGGDFCPTQVAVDERRFGGSGDVWVADCYGQSLVHRFAEDGTYLATIDGEQGAGRFVHPHAIHIDRRGDEPELYVADRRNKRVQVYGLDGRFRRTVGEGVLVSPSGFLAYGQNLLVTELDSRIAVLGPDDELVTYIGEYEPDGRARPGWPNAVDDGLPTRPPLRAGAFNTPHGIAADADGNLYVTEWLIGGRLVRLARSGSAA